MKKKFLILLTGIAILIGGCGKQKLSEGTEKHNDPTEKPALTSEENNSSVTKIKKDDFIENLNTALTEYNLYTLEPGNSFEESEKLFDSYTMLGIQDSAYLACATTRDGSDLTDILVISNPGHYMYYYATNTLLSIDQSIDWKKILSELYITEDGDCENDIYTTEYDGLNIVHEKSSDQETFSVMFY